MNEAEGEALDATTAHGSSARSFGHYRLLQELGRGAQGVVHLAQDENLSRRVALKMLAGPRAQDPDVRERFQREAALASKLAHPGICGVHEFGEAHGIPFIAMQFVEGVPLSDLIDSARSGADGDGRAAGTSLVGKDSTQDILRIVESAARALHAAHEVGLVHRDVKPANIMIDRSGNPVLLDFGLARDVGDSGHTLTESGQALGTPAYMAAEQILGRREEIDRRTDVYALGVTLYECLTLRRPFEAESFEQLYHQILQGAPARPRKLNPRIPTDLGTVVEVAMDRQRERRYATALDLAEDLRRVRAFEPIRAKPAGALTLSAKWVRRKPAQAIAYSAGLLFVLGAAGVGMYGGLREKADVHRSLERTREAIAREDPTAARESLARARELRPGDADMLTLATEVDRIEAELDREERRDEALRNAAAARAESVARQREYADQRARLVVLREELETGRAAVFAGFAPLGERATFAGRERDLRAHEVSCERLLLEAREALERAARFEAPWGITHATRNAFASYFLSRWREAVAEGDALRADLYREEVERYDTEGEHRAELLGHARLTVLATPPNAELHLFRYCDSERFRPGADVPRQVPAPTSGIGLALDAPWAAEFPPGDPCLVVDSVAEGSPADAAGLRAGDHVLAIDGQRAAEGLFLVAPLEGLAADALPARCVAIDDLPVRDRIDLAAAIPPDAREVELELANGRALVADTDALRVTDAAELLERGAPSRPTVVRALRGDTLVDFVLEAGEPSGLVCSVTAYPLVCAAKNRVAAGTPFELEPGSYLLVGRAPGFAEQRLPLRVPRLGALDAELSLLPEDAVPQGFVWIPPGPARVGGDPRAREPLPPREVHVDGFFVQRHELSNHEWDVFRSDPKIAERIAASGGTLYAPRESSGPMPLENLGGPEAPVMGVSWDDLSDYLAWRNAVALEAGEPWVYDLPTEVEWEKAARGVDGRAFPWGDRFDYAATTGLHSRSVPLYDAPRGHEPRDESPWGVRDMGGFREEWTRDEYVVNPDAPTIYRWRGGSWRSTREQEFRAASRGYGLASFTGGTVGARLVARPRDAR